MEKSAAIIPLRYLKGIGPKRAKALNKLGLETVEDLLYYFPRRWEDRTKFLPVAQLEAGQQQTIKAKVISVAERESWKRRNFKILEAITSDGTANIVCVWFNQQYLKDYFKPGQTLILYGRVERYGGRLQMNSPEFEIAGDGEGEALNTARIVPIYCLPEHSTQRYLRKVIKRALDEYLPRLGDFLPYDIRSRNNLLNLAKGLLEIHFPGSEASKQEAFRRLSFDEFFLFQVPLALRKTAKKEKPGIAHKIEGRLVKDFIASLPFKLTVAQEKVINEIKSDMSKPQAMQRLLQGDVGCGKTVVATIAALMAIQGGYQAVMMAPTEILARQHYDRLGVLGQEFRDALKVGLLSGSASGKEKDKICRAIEEGKINLIIGTHALLEEKVKFKNLGLVVIDEQHKFGVGQRALLPKKGINPDVLIMTATPIPRTLAITLYGDLDISVINELPKGRLPIKTMYFTQEEIGLAYDVAQGHLKNGSQVYIVYPVIEESYALDIAGAKKMYGELKKGEFRGFRLGLIHGRMKQKEQDEVMLRFKNKELDILVSTTVLEVGIDIQDATCMIIEHAERFGLAQLHQLRGRVGRGTQESACLLVTGASTQEAKARIEAMLVYQDGFRIAEEDLRIRGPGEFFGSRQHGLSELKIANPLTQMQLLKRAREEAIKLINSDSHLVDRQNVLLKEKLLQRFPEYEKLMVVG
ncbi:ATP-dependent DNA helicase RecG [bacterium]|nr:MAG: ATP-dependent DNA helicase RecG [bacterium]